MSEYATADLDVIATAQLVTELPPESRVLGAIAAWGRVVIGEVARPLREPSAAPERVRPNVPERVRPSVAAVPRLSLTIEEACAALGVSWDFWQEHVAHEVRVVRRGRRKLVPVAALQAWLDRNAETPL